MDSEAGHFKNHVLPMLGEKRLNEVRTADVRALGGDLRTKKRMVRGKERTLAPRTVRHVYGSLHALFEDAEVEELIAKNPVKLKRGEQAPNEDADPEWRANAVYSRSEVEILISDPRIDEARRVTHLPREEVFDMYTRPQWATLCAEVAKLKIELREGKVLELPREELDQGTFWAHAQPQELEDH